MRTDRRLLNTKLREAVMAHLYNMEVSAGVDAASLLLFSLTLNLAYRRSNNSWLWLYFLLEDLTAEQHKSAGKLRSCF